MKKPLTAAIIGAGGTGTLVLLAVLAGLSAAGGNGEPAGNAAPVVTLTAAPAPTRAATAAPVAIATRASAGPASRPRPAGRAKPPGTAAAPPSPTAAAAATAPTTVPVAAPVVPAPTTPAQGTPAACHPVTKRGACYEPGEICRKADHLIAGVAGDGEPITCEDSGGWHWEPS